MTLVDLNRELVSAIPEPCSITVGGRLKLGEMGLIETITVVEGHATKAWCLIDSAFVHFAAMQDYIRDVLSGLPGLNGVTVAQSLTELWTPDRTSAA